MERLTRRFILSAPAAVALASGTSTVLSACATTVDAGAVSSVLSLHPANPHYFLFRGRPTVLIGSTEHYGAVINRDFNYLRYLDTLAASNLNVTRIFTGQYRERAGLFSPRAPGFEIVENTLAPNANAFVAPWVRSDQPGAGDGRNKFDLSRWNDEFFHRLHDFCAQSGRRGIVVEVCLFSAYYVRDHGSYFWDISPFKHNNNVNGVGDVDGADAFTIQPGPLLDAQEAMVRKIVGELGAYDNVYFAICNEPVNGMVPVHWQAHIARLIREVDSASPKQHLICQEFVDAQGDLIAPMNSEADRRHTRENWAQNRLPDAQMIAFHIARPRVVLDNYGANLPVGENEIVFVASDAGNRVSAWRLLLAGAAFRHGVDYSFARGHEDGSFVVPAGGAGGGSPELRHQLGFLHRFMAEMDFIAMRPATNVIQSGLPVGALAVGLQQEGECYAFYISHEVSGDFGLAPVPIDSSPQQSTLILEIAPGAYEAQWIDPKIGAVVQRTRLEGGSGVVVVSPAYSEDIALKLMRSA